MNQPEKGNGGFLVTKVTNTRPFDELRGDTHLGAIFHVLAGRYAPSVVLELLLEMFSKQNVEVVFPNGI
jgi:hypothetical protein